MSELKKKLQQAMGAGLRQGLERLKLDELISRYPEGVSITGLEPAQYNDNEYYVYTFAEDKGLWFSGGGDLKKMGDKLLELSEGDITGLNAELKSDPIRVKIWKGRTKRGNTYTMVKVLE